MDIIIFMPEPKNTTQVITVKYMKKIGTEYVVRAVGVENSPCRKQITGKYIYVSNPYTIRTATNRKIGMNVAIGNPPV